MRLALVIVLVCASATARADELDAISQASPPSATAAETPPAPTPRPKRNYAYATIALDLALLATIAPMERAYGEDVVPVYGLAWLVGAPIVHGLEGNSRESGVSLLRRLLLPVGGGLVGGLVADALSDCGECWDVPAGVVIGAGIGVVVATVLDWARSRVED